VEIGRDGCRVPLPWTVSGSSFGFGTGGAHLPQPEWYAGHSVEAQEPQEDSTLSLYRRALALRSQLQTAEVLEWLETGRADVLAFRRPNGWISVTNFGTEAFGLPDGEVLVSSSPLTAGSLPGATTAWLQA
jgi:alpha-glucosidase